MECRKNDEHNLTYEEIFHILSSAALHESLDGATVSGRATWAMKDDTVIVGGLYVQQHCSSRCTHINTWIDSLVNSDVIRDTPLSQVFALGLGALEVHLLARMEAFTLFDFGCTLV